VYDNPAVSEIVRVPFDINETKNKVETRKLAEGFVRRSSRLELGSPARFMCFVYWCPQRQETKECIPGTQWISSFTLFQGDLDKNINFHSYLLDFAAVYKHDVQLSTPRQRQILGSTLARGTIVASGLRRNPGRNPSYRAF
jgi:hypothetical protein